MNKLFMILLVLACLHAMPSYAGNCIPLFGGYDSRLGDIWSASLFSRSGSKAYWLGGGMGAFINKGNAADIEKAAKEEFEARYAERGDMEFDFDVNNFNLFFAYFHDADNPIYFGLGYSKINFEGKMNVTNYLDGESASVRGRWEASSIDILLGYANINKDNLFFDIRLGYGFTSEEPTKVEIENEEMEFQAGGNILDKTFITISLGYCF